MTLILEKSNVLNVLSTIIHPKAQKDIITLNLVKGLSATENKITFILDYSPSDAEFMPIIKNNCEIALKKNFGDVAINIATSKQVPSEPTLPPLNIKHKIAISSAKGGVGKSTTTINLAQTLQQKGFKVGILDADIYGPSIPLLMDIHDKPQSNGKMIVPLEKHGIKAMSIGFLMPKDGAAVWRGPMVSSAVQQMIYQVAWGELDYLLIDMPPGTGDIHLTITQKLALTGAIIVSTPQEIAIQDTLKGIEMFKKTHVPILGMIENMSYFICDGCDKKHYIFDQDGAKKATKKLDIPFLGEIPIELKIREESNRHASFNQKDYFHYYENIIEKLPKY